MPCTARRHATPSKGRGRSPGCRSVPPEPYNALLLVMLMTRESWAAAPGFDDEGEVGLRP